VDPSGVEGPDKKIPASFFSTPVFYHRLLLLVTAIAITIPVFYKSRSVREVSDGAAFSILTSSRGYVRISGNVKRPGIYLISANKMTIAAIKMAGLDESQLSRVVKADAESILVNGTALHVAVEPDKRLLLTRSSMTADERLVLGVPLDINIMNAAEFDKVSGIGPLMAQRIVQFRHNNGGSMKVSDLLLIEGIGEITYNRLQKYF
jgi:competence protein ComEA